MSRKNCVTQQKKKISGIKIGWDLWTLGDGDPQFKCKKVRAEQKSVEKKLCDPVEQKSVE